MVYNVKISLINFNLNYQHINCKHSTNNHKIKYPYIETCGTWLPVTTPQKLRHMATSSRFEKVRGGVEIGVGKYVGVWEEMWEEVREEV